MFHLLCWQSNLGCGAEECLPEEEHLEETSSSGASPEPVPILKPVVPQSATTENRPPAAQREVTSRMMPLMLGGLLLLGGGGFWWAATGSRAPERAGAEGADKAAVDQAPAATMAGQVQEKAAAPAPRITPVPTPVNPFALREQNAPAHLRELGNVTAERLEWNLASDPKAHQLFLHSADEGELREGAGFVVQPKVSEVAKGSVGQIVSVGGDFYASLDCIPGILLPNSTRGVTLDLNWFLGKSYIGNLAVEWYPATGRLRILEAYHGPDGTLSGFNIRYEGDAPRGEANRSYRLSALVQGARVSAYLDGAYQGHTKHQLGSPASDVRLRLFTGYSSTISSLELVKLSTTSPATEPSDEVLTLRRNNYPAELGKPDAPDELVFLTSLYRSLLEREPDADGFGEQLRRLQGRPRLAAYQGLLGSSEYQRKKKTDAEFIRDLFQGVAGREPRPDEISVWVGMLQQNRDRGSVLQQFYALAEQKKL